MIPALWTYSRTHNLSESFAQTCSSHSCIFGCGSTLLPASTELLREEREQAH
jgi:hypothetical protein